MAVSGGLRTRLIFDSIYEQIRDGLTTLGWFDSGRGHEPVTFIPEPVVDTDEVKLNTIALAEGGMFDRDFEIGSNMAEAEYSFYVDIYAQNGDLGRHLANDIRDLVRGRHGGRTGSGFTIYDYQMATPSSIGWLELERAQVFKEDLPTRPWQKFWYSVRFDVIDYYYGEDDPAAPSDDFYGGY